MKITHKRWEAIMGALDLAEQTLRDDLEISEPGEERAGIVKQINILNSAEEVLRERFDR